MEEASVRDPHKNILAGTFRLRCTIPGCPGERVIEHAMSAGLTLGSIVPFSQSEPTHGRCHRCMRHKMMVIEVPQEPPPEGPKGFRRIPSE